MLIMPFTAPVMTVESTPVIPSVERIMPATATTAETSPVAIVKRASF